MIILVSGATTTMRTERRSYCGVLVVPNQKQGPEHVLWPGCVWAADNGAFKRFDRAAFYRMLQRFVPVRHSCKFVAAPDVVGDARETLKLFVYWSPWLHAVGYPVALVAQDGLLPRHVPWGALDALFIGGTTEWKLGPHARACAAAAKGRGKWLHMGRVNSNRRLHYAESIGCDSVDGSGFSKFPSSMLRTADLWHAEPRMPLDD